MAAPTTRRRAATRAASPGRFSFPPCWAKTPRWGDRSRPSGPTPLEGGPVEIRLPHAPILAALATLTLATPAHAHKGCNTTRCVERVADHECSNAAPRACIIYAALKYRQPVQDAIRVATCESTLNPLAANGNDDDGLFQILTPSTWSTTPYASHSVWEARWNALAAMWMWAPIHGGGHNQSERNQWECQ